MSSALDIFTSVYLNIPSVRVANYTLCFIMGTWFLNMINYFNTLGLSILIVAIMLIIGVDETVVCTIKYIRKLKTLEQLHREYLEDSDEEDDDEEDDDEDDGEVSTYVDDGEPPSGETPNKNIDRNEIELQSDDEDDNNDTLQVPTCCKRYVSIGVKTTDDIIPEEDLDKLNVNSDDC